MMSTINDDILYEIFMFSIKEYSIKTPLYLSHCCSQWRSVALNAPPLWTHILVDEYDNEKQRDCLRAWLKRSKGHPLDLYICQPAEGGDKFDNHLRRCLDLLLPHARRWHTLRLQYRRPSNQLWGVFLGCPFPELQTLSLDFGETPLRTEPQWSVISRALTPKLRDLTLPAPLLYHWPVLNGEPAPGLKKLAITQIVGDDISLRRYLQIMRSVPSLEHLDIGVSLHRCRAEDRSPQLYNPPPDQIIIAPHLKILALNNFPIKIRLENLPFIANIMAPALTHLRNPINISIVPRLVSLPTFPLPSLETLSLAMDPPECFHGAVGILQSTHLVELFSNLPHLLSLEIGRVDFPRSGEDGYPFMKALATLCPRLERLTLKHCGGEGMDDEIRALIDARQQEHSSVQKIRAIEIRGTQVLTRHIYRWLKANVEDVRAELW